MIICRERYKLQKSLLNSMKKLFILTAMMCLVTLSEAQMKTYLNIEAGPQWSIIKVADPGNYFTGSYVKSSMAGATLGQEIFEDLSVYAGVYYQQFKDGINMIDQRSFQSRSTSYSALLFPLRFEYRVQMSEFPVSLIPRIGYMYGRISAPDPIAGTGIISAPDGTAFSYQMQQAFESTSLHMLETSMGVGLRIFGFWQASLHLSYLTGFTEPMSNTVAYSGSDGSDYTAVYSSKGNTIYTTLALQIPVSNIWQNKDYRIRARIEQSAFKGKPLERKGQIYVGAEIGSLWRQFDSSNPAIGARPMEGSGIFRYANMHTGAYVGYMLTDELGIDLGANYQRSSTFYSIMYDHAVNLTIKTPAPLFLEVPLRIRYFYNAYKNKIFYVVYGGASMLTHFSSTDFETGGAPFTYTSPLTGTPASATSTYTASRIAKFIPVLRIGTGVEYALPMEFPLIVTLYINYMHGFTAIDNTTISNTGPEPLSTASVSNNGSGWSLDVGVKIPFRFAEKGKCGKLPEKLE